MDPDLHIVNVHGPHPDTDQGLLLDTGQDLGHHFTEGQGHVL